MLAGQSLESNSTDSYASSRRHSYSKSLDVAIPYSILSGILSLVGGVSNLALMIALLKYVQIREKTYLYMFSLFLSDLLYNVIFQPQVAYYQFPSTTMTATGSVFLHLCSTTFLLTGVSSLFFATLDKYVFIRHPFIYASFVSQTRTLLVVLSMWLFCVVFSIFRLKKISFFQQSYVAILFILFLLTICLQILIFMFARKQLRRIQLMNRDLRHNDPSQNNASSFPRGRTAAGSNKAAKTIGLMLSIYICSWLPSTLYHLQYRLFGGDHVTFITYLKFFNMMIQLHSCINPYIFVFRTKEVRVGVHIMLQHFGLRPSASNPPYGGDNRFHGCNLGLENHLHTGENETQSEECNKSSELALSTTHFTKPEGDNNHSPKGEASTGGIVSTSSSKQNHAFVASENSPRYNRK